MKAASSGRTALWCYSLFLSPLAINVSPIQEVLLIEDVGSCHLGKTTTHFKQLLNCCYKRKKKLDLKVCGWSHN